METNWKMHTCNGNKPKVKANLTAQVFSASVADALEYCSTGLLKLPQFKGCETTVVFLRHVESAFDVLNSRNPLGKGFKAPMMKTNKDRFCKILQEAMKFLLNLKDGSGKLLHLGPRKTGVIGFVASVADMLKLFPELVDAPTVPLPYLLACKFSQDHIELFFCSS